MPAAKAPPQAQAQIHFICLQDRRENPLRHHRPFAQLRPEPFRQRAQAQIRHRKIVTLALLAAEAQPVAMLAGLMLVFPQLQFLDFTRPHRRQGCPSHTRPRPPPVAQFYPQGCRNIFHRQESQPIAPFILRNEKLRLHLSPIKEAILAMGRLPAVAARPCHRHYRARPDPATALQRQMFAQDGPAIGEDRPNAFPRRVHPGKADRLAAHRRHIGDQQRSLAQHPSLWQPGTDPQPNNPFCSMMAKSSRVNGRPSAPSRAIWRTATAKPSRST